MGEAAIVKAALARRRRRVVRARVRGRERLGGLEVGDVRTVWGCG